MIWLWGSFGGAAMIGEPCSAPSLSDRGYDGIPFRDPRPYAVRTRCVYKATIPSGDRCSTFYDVAYLLTLNDNEIERFAEIARNKLISGMRLVQNITWKQDPWHQSASTLRNHLDEGALRSQYVGLWTELNHKEHNLFGPADGPPRTSVDSDQDCYFEVQLQYILKLNAPAFDNVIVVDAAPRCGSRLRYEETFELKRADGVALTTWMNGLDMGREYQRLLDNRLSQLTSHGTAPLELSEELARIRQTPSYQDAVAHCQSLIR
jgi:hypothetical protein